MQSRVEIATCSNQFMGMEYWCRTRTMSREKKLVRFGKQVVHGGSDAEVESPAAMLCDGMLYDVFAFLLPPHLTAEFADKKQIRPFPGRDEVVRNVFSVRRVCKRWSTVVAAVIWKIPHQYIHTTNANIVEGLSLFDGCSHISVVDVVRQLNSLSLSPPHINVWHHTSHISAHFCQSRHAHLSPHTMSHLSTDGWGVSQPWEWLLPIIERRDRIRAIDMSTGDGTDVRIVAQVLQTLPSPRMLQRLSVDDYGSGGLGANAFAPMVDLLGTENFSGVHALELKLITGCPDNLDGFLRVATNLRTLELDVLANESDMREDSDIVRCRGLPPQLRELRLVLPYFVVPEAGRFEFPDSLTRLSLRHDLDFETDDDDNGAPGDGAVTTRQSRSWRARIFTEIIAGAADCTQRAFQRRPDSTGDSRGISRLKIKRILSMRAASQTRLLSVGALSASIARCTALAALTIDVSAPDIISAILLAAPPSMRKLRIDLSAHQDAADIITHVVVPATWSYGVVEKLSYGNGRFRYVRESR